MEAGAALVSQPPEGGCREAWRERTRVRASLHNASAANSLDVFHGESNSWAIPRGRGPSSIMFGWRILAVAVEQGHEGWGPRVGFTGILESTNPPGAMTWAHVWLSARRIFFRSSEDHNQKYPRS